MAGSSAIERATASAPSTARTGAATRPCSPTSAATVSNRPLGSAARRSMSDPEASAASTERRGRGHHCWPSRSRARARRTDSAAGVIGESSPVASIPSHRAITRIPPSGDGPRPDARRTEGSDRRPGHGRGGEHHPEVAGHLGPHDLEATRGHPPFVLGPADALGRPRVGADAEQPGALVDADQGHPTTGERDRGAQRRCGCVPGRDRRARAARRRRARATRARRPGATRPAARPTIDGPAEPVVSTVLPQHAR